MNVARTTVVVATRNRADQLRRTVDHLLKLRPRPPVIIVGNALSDDAVARMRPLAARNGGIRLIELNDNHGAAARTDGVLTARTPYIAFSDDDSWWAPDALPRAQRVLDRYPHVGLIATKTLVGPDQVVDPTSRLMADSPLGIPPDLRGPAVLGFLACSAIVRRSAYLGAGGFSSLLHFAGEETLLATTSRRTAERCATSMTSWPIIAQNPAVGDPSHAPASNCAIES